MVAVGIPPRLHAPVIRDTPPSQGVIWLFPLGLTMGGDSCAVHPHRGGRQILLARRATLRLRHEGGSSLST